MICIISVLVYNVIITDDGYYDYDYKISVL